MGECTLEQDSNLTYLFAAYSLIWVVLFGYLVRLRRREQELSQVVRRLTDLASSK